MSVQLHSRVLQRAPQSTRAIMLQVMLACTPGILLSVWFFGYGIVLNIVLASAFALFTEAVILRVRARNWWQGLQDNSALVTAVLFGIAVPPGLPWWLVATGIVFAIAIVKHSFGGLGQNPFNPAMSGYLLLLLAYPLDMTAWHVPATRLFDDTAISPLGWYGLQQSLLASFPGLSLPSATSLPAIDGLAMATPLIEFKMAATSALLSARESGLSFFARESGTGWELVNFGYLLGGLYLLARRIISWHIPVSIIGTVALLATLLYAPNSFAIYGTPYLHLFGSATMLGAFFIATDPVSAATTRRGQLLYGVCIGLGIYCIRVWGSYLDSVAIAVLFGNLCAPLLDHWCRPTIYGHGARQLPVTGGEWKA
jgi:electron transport complex protein RnfD